MRISDDDRQRALDELTEHLRDGRLGMDDYAERVTEVYGAETLADVDRARRDLPWMRVALPSGADPRTQRALGSGAHHGASGRASPRAWRSRLVLALTALLVVAGVVVAVTAQVVWVVVLVAGWLIGLLQGRASARRR